MFRLKNLLCATFQVKQKSNKQWPMKAESR